MRKITALAVMFLFVLAGVPGPAQSIGAHFQKKSTSAVLQLPSGNLLVSWEEAGLGFTNIDYSLTGDVNATYFCRTTSGNIPNANNKHTVDTSASANGSFEPKNGKVTASLTLVAPPAPVSDPPTCGNGQTLDIQSITWSNIVLTDTTNTEVFDFGNATFTHTFYPAPK
jgi:hypothetical protein